MGKAWADTTVWMNSPDGVPHSCPKRNCKGKGNNVNYGKQNLCQTQWYISAQVGGLGPASWFCTLIFYSRPPSFSLWSLYELSRTAVTAAISGPVISLCFAKKEDYALNISSHHATNCSLTCFLLGKSAEPHTDDNVTLHELGVDLIHKCNCCV